MRVCSEGKVKLGASKLFAVLVVQTALLLFLGYRIMILETRAPEAQTQPINNNPVATPINSNADTSYNAASRAETRQIIREEIDAVEGRLLEAIEQSGAVRSKALTSRPRKLDGRETAQINTMVENQINSFVAQGDASQAEMAELEQMIAKLPPSERIKAMGQLSKAVNNGQLDVRF